MLQTRGRMTAAELAEHFEVSVRTIYRDMDQLSAAGVPVYGDRGRAGGFALRDGFRTRLTGMTPSEAETLFLAGLPGPAAELGLAELLATARLKLLASLPAGLEADRITSRFHLDAAGWFRERDTVEQLPLIARAVFDQRLLRIGYLRGNRIRQRVVAPLGLVLKSGAWYLVAQKEEALLTYKAINIREAEVLDRIFDRPPQFDLAAHWRDAASRYETGLYRETATIRLSPQGWALLDLLGSHISQAARQTAAPPDENGWRQCQVPMESADEGIREFLRLGSDIEVLAPAPVRRAMADTLSRLAEMYRD
jgi:predicted DNA-binding transcriptional regulator YafY